MSAVTATVDDLDGFWRLNDPNCPALAPGFFMLGGGQKTVLNIQQRLKALGFDSGALDGAWRPRTRAAAIAFQKTHRLPVDGVVGPKTTAALNAAPVPSGAGKAPTLVTGEPIWVLEGRRRMGLRECNPILKQFLKEDGRTLGDPERLPWCGDFVETCIRIALPNEVVPTNAYFARNWLTVGIKCPEPVLGAVAVFKRGPTSGHVGFVIGADRTYLSILGCNQSDSLSVSRIARSRALDYRWPVTAGNPVVIAMPKGDRRRDDQRSLMHRRQAADHQDDLNWLAD